jgi:hypothetical protein
LDITDLTFETNTTCTGGFISPSVDVFHLGQINPSPPCTWYGSITGPSSFGSGSLDPASSGSGNVVGVQGNLSYIVVPNGYTSGSALSASNTWNSATLSSLGLPLGTSTWTWGTAADADSFTLQIGSSVPEPGTLALLCVGAAVLGIRRRFVARFKTSLTEG